MGSEHKIQALRDLWLSEKVDIMIIQETKVAVVELLDIKHRCWKASHIEAIDSKGALGGLVTFWDENKFLLISKELSQNGILTSLKENETGRIYNIYNVYAPNLY